MSKLGDLASDKKGLSTLQAYPLDKCVIIIVVLDVELIDIMWFELEDI